MSVLSKRNLQAAFLLLVTMALLSFAASPASAQKDKKKKKQADTPTDTGKPLLAMGDGQQIDYMISDMLGAWQIGDIEKMHRDYAEDVSVVSGAWEPPVVGWTRYLALYQQQRTHMSSVRMDRQDTFIKVEGTIGWASYQWEFQGLMDGQETGARGQTTLILEKRKDRWVIVHNHTSLIQTFQPPPPAATAPAPAAQPAKPAAP